jgi:hypothetical protein
VKSIAAERDSLNAKLTAIHVDQGVLTVATKKGLMRGNSRSIKDPEMEAATLLAGTPCK